MKIYFYIIMFSLGLLFVSCTNVILNEKNDVDNIGNKNSGKSPNPNSQMHDLINLSEYSESQKKSLLQSASNKASKRVLQIELNLIDKEVNALIDDCTKSGISAPMPDVKELTSDVYLNY